MARQKKDPRRVEIGSRVKFTSPEGGDRVVRYLKCGHMQGEPSGGKAHLALTAVCRECWPEPAPSKQRNDRLLNLKEGES
jgi:hypothetical protein